jgi:hypothetical protein
MDEQAFEPFPEIKGLDVQTLQELCDRWVVTPVAKECGVDQLRVSRSPKGIKLDFGIFIGGGYDSFEAVHFPFDNLLDFIIDTAIPEENRDDLRARLRLLRQKLGPNVWQRYTLTDKKPLFLRCKNAECRHLMMTQFSLFPGQKLIWEGDTVACPRCSQTFAYVTKDLFMLT